MPRYNPGAIPALAAANSVQSALRLWTLESELWILSPSISQLVFARPLAYLLTVQTQLGMAHFLACSVRLGRLLRLSLTVPPYPLRFPA